MEFSVNHPLLFLMAGILIAVVLAQSVFFLVKAMRRSKELGMDQTKIKKTIKTAAIFTIAPAIAIVITVISLSQSLGIALPWLRLSVIGSITYETVAANNALNAAEVGAGSAITDPSLYVTVLWVMTLGISIGLILVPFVTKKIQGGMNKIGMKDKKWGEIFNNAMFVGMISAFLGMVFADVRNGLKGWIPIFVLLVSAIIMALCGLLIKKCNMKWLETYAMAISMVGAMIFAVIITPIIG